MTDELPGAGPELDAMVAEALGQNPDDPKSWPWGGEYSVSRCNALWALEEWREQHPDWTGQIILPYGEHRYYEVQLWPVPERYGDGLERLAKSKVLPVAICHAIVRASRGGAE